MMRILIVSDTHGNKWSFLDAVKNEPTAEYLYFLGDGSREFDEIKNTYGTRLACIGVCGNCDFASSLPKRDIRTINGQKIYATHGYVENVKYGLNTLKYSAMSEKCQLVLFGHTHQPLTLYEEGVHYFNPGSLHNGFYGVADITDNGIICINKKLPNY